MSKYTVTITPSGKTTISAFCLKSDLWQDYLDFVNDAQEEHKRNNTRQENRYLRAALLSLFAHLEATVNDVIYKSSLGNKKLDKSISEKCLLISVHAKIESPAIDEIKKIRNILVHPGGKKNDSHPFDALSQETIEAYGNLITNWLNEISEATGISRFSDTNRFVKDMANNLGSSIDTSEV